MKENIDDSSAASAYIHSRPHFRAIARDWESRGKRGRSREEPWTCRKSALASLVFFVGAARDTLYIMESRYRGVSSFDAASRPISCLCMSGREPPLVRARGWHMVVSPLPSIRGVVQWRLSREWPSPPRTRDPPVLLSLDSRKRRQLAETRASRPEHIHGETGNMTPCSSCFPPRCPATLRAAALCKSNLPRISSSSSSSSSTSFSPLPLLSRIRYQRNLGRRSKRAAPPRLL